MTTAFWDAFWNGLTCPTQLYAPLHGDRYKHVGRVDAAWKKVGGYISDGMKGCSDQVRDRPQRPADQIEKDGEYHRPDSKPNPESPKSVSCMAFARRDDERCG
jgi:hypothetical protein